MDKGTKKVATKSRPSAQKSEGSLKLSGDPLTGPRRAAEPPKASARKTPKAETTKPAATRTSAPRTSATKAAKDKRR